MTDKKEIPETTCIVQGRLSHCHVFVAKSFEDGSAAKYRTWVLVPKEEITIGGVKMGGKKAVSKIRDAILAAKIAKWGDDTSKHPKIPQDKSLMRDGDAQIADDEGNKSDASWVTEETRGHYIVSVSEHQSRPDVLDRDGSTVLGESDGKIYSGAYARVIINTCLLYTSPSPRDLSTSRMPSSA